jgi:hypothetical protein
VREGDRVWLRFPPEEIRLFDADGRLTPSDA